MHLVPPLPPKVDVLLVDDRQLNLDALDAILSGSDYNLVHASSGEEALRLLRQHDFAVVLLDVMMPEMDGFECAARIRATEACRHTPIIFVSAVADQMNFVFRGYSAGAVDYIIKPLEPAVVRAKVAVFAELFRAKSLLQTQLEETRSLCRQLEDEVAQGHRDREDVAHHLRALLERLESAAVATSTSSIADRSRGFRSHT